MLKTTQELNIGEGVYCRVLVTGEFLFLMSCNRTEVWQHNQTFAFHKSVAQWDTGVLIGNCERRKHEPGDRTRE